MKLHPKSRKESSLSDRDGDFTFPTGKERLYDRTLKALVLADMSLSHSGHFPKTIGYGAGSLKRGSSPIYSIRSLIESGTGAFLFQT